jgi:hypothetical protein
LFGLNSNVRERELGESLQKIYGQEMDVYKNIVKMMSEALEKGLNAVQEALGPPGTMYPKNVRKAARTLGKYAQDFARLETDCNYTALGLQKLIDELGR